MDANELRLPCYVEYNGSYKTMAELFNISNNKQWNPIPLTEEWLLRFGFKKIYELENYWFELEINGLMFISNDIGKDAYSENLEFIFLQTSMYELNLDLEVKYVHKLQNLYFELCNKEL